VNRILLCLALVLSLAACGAEPEWATDAEVSRAVYVHDSPASITLFTVLNNRSNEGAHSGLLINGSQRVMFDPAGTWHHPDLPERNDLHFGMNDKALAFYIDYHARETFRVVEQTVFVTPAQADAAIRLAMSYGAVPKAQCTRSISSILQGVPGFEDTPGTWYPAKLMKAFGKRPGVIERTITDTDADNNHGVLLVQASIAPQ
jgi:hypothetical protein